MTFPTTHTRFSVNRSMVDMAGAAATRATRRTLETAAPPSASCASIFYIDQSQSMEDPFRGGTTKFVGAHKAFRSYAYAVAERDPNHPIAVVVFNHHARALIPFTPVAGAIHTLDSQHTSIVPQGRTDFTKALLEGEQLALTMPGAMIEHVLITDGHHNGRRDPVAVAGRLKSHGHRIAAIGIGADPSEVSVDTLTRVASVMDGAPCFEFCGDLVSLTTVTNTLGQCPLPGGRF